MTDRGVQRGGDRLIRALAMDGLLRVTVVRTTALVGELARRHAMTPVAAAATGRVATAALMLGTTLKDEQVLTLHVRGGGPLGMLRATANAHGTVRAYATHPKASVADGSVATAVRGDDPERMPGGRGGGVLEVVKDLGLKDPYHGLVPLATGTIYDDVAYYLMMSEQTSSAVALGESQDAKGVVVSAGGYLVQALPGVGEEVEERIGQLPRIDHMLGDAQMTLEEVLARLLPESDARVVSNYPVSFVCGCSREKLAVGLRLIGRKETWSILREEGSPLQLRCHFCNDVYYFTESQLQAIFTEH
ncbi:MAG: Hsp33 family molecular chaperone HslO [Myxococcota bacterium]